MKRFCCENHPKNAHAKTCVGHLLLCLELSKATRLAEHVNCTRERNLSFQLMIRISE